MRTRYGVHMNKYDFYDHEKVGKFKEERSEKLMRLYRRCLKAKEKGDMEAKEKIMLSIIKHKAAEEEYKKSAKEAGFYWY